jgi:4-alpha-glucanotransferase
VKDALAAFLRRGGWLGEEEPGAEDVLAACLSFLAASPAGIVIAGLEDLFLETNPQNVPGTWTERPNWLRKARHGIEAFRDMPRVVRILREVDRIRKGKEEGRGNPVRSRREAPTRKEAG